MISGNAFHRKTPRVSPDKRAYVGARVSHRTNSSGTPLYTHSDLEAMEPLYLYDISTLINSKTTERIISSMAAQLCHLIIAMEWEGVDNEAFPDLRKTAEELAKSTEELAFAARRVAEESNDEVLRGEMCPAAESVLLSGKSTLLAAQKLNIQPEIQSHKEELIVSAQRVLMETMRILQIEEDASVRRIIQAADWLLDCLSTMESAGDISAMLAAFRDFSESLLLLNNLTERRIQELKVSPQQKHLAETLQILKKSESSLAKSEWTGLAARETFEMLPHECWKDPNASNGESLWGALRPETEALQDDTSRLGQVTRELATQMFYMTQFLKRKGPITTKEQLVDCAGQVASKGQVFVKFGHIIAKNCLDDRCAPAVLRITEQIQTISSQLSILARVKAAIAGSRCSAELLVNNAQNLIQAVLQLLKAAEAACIKGLRQPSPDSEEGESIND
ncbi:hypothetical protein Y1Q_0002887 [Alligator mississippiensis]|uniref:Vinculin n=1 Tax=Alligator mississippiensis TaxID=8496 RepID=A0A151MCL1_ALLMI|nr:hypothetical protein Y1Q_0002887 [Alligator mississippiensis]